MVERLLFLAILVTAALVFVPGLPGFFIYDDYPNLLRHTAFLEPIESLHDVSRAVREGLSSALGRPLSTISFALNHMASDGFDPLALKLTNIAIHLCNGIVLFFLARLLAKNGLFPGATERQARLAGMACMALWLLHPLSLTSVLYVVQRMNSLSALFTLLGVLAYAQARMPHRSARTAMLLLILSLCVAWPTAVFSKENGVLMVLFALVVEASLMAAGAKRRPMREAYGYFAIGLLPFVAALGQLVIDPAGIVGGYGGRDFTLVERLLTESRVLWLYVGLIVFPDVRSMSLYHDDFLVSTGLLEPGTTLLAIAAWGILLGCAIAWRRRVPLLFFAVSWFLMGHLVESTIIPLLLVQEHRNYVPQIGLLLPAAIILCQKTASLRWSWLPVTLVAMLLAMTTANRAATWGDYGRFVVHGIVNHPGSVTTHTNAIKYFTDRAGREPGIAMELYDKALFHVRELQRIDPDNGAQTGLYRLIIEGRLAMGGQLENAIVESPHLLSALKESRLTPLDVNLLGHAVNCTVTRSCDIAPRYLEEVLTAALDSGKNGGHSRAYLFGARADLRFAVLRDLGGAIDDLEQSSRLDPRVGSYTQRWIELLILAGRYGEAKVVLARYGARLTPSAVSLIEREIRSREAGQP